MKITTKEKYSVRFLYALGKVHKNGPISLKVISEQEKIPHKYLTQIALVLKSAGIVQSLPGPKGGYMLTKPPKKIKYLEIFEAFQGKLAISNCLNYPGICPRSSKCKSRIILNEITEKFSDILKSYSIQDLIDL
jgi:Rrf2 family protein